MRRLIHKARMMFVPRHTKHSHLDPADLLRVGTLKYTGFGLMMVCFWLLWGDFVFSLMETITPSILPLKLNQLGASNMVMSVILTTVPSAMNFFINPVVSFRSDRHRSRFGRRIPFLLFATPFVTLALIAMAFSPEIGTWIHAHLGGSLGMMSPNTLIIATIGIVMVLFQFFNMFISSVYYYLFNDVVPEHFVARFMGLFRIVGTIAGMVYNWFIFKYALTHMREIFVIVALLYFAGYIAMCWRVKEGEYPPPPPLDDNRKGLWASIKTYCRESFTHPFYLCTFAFGACLQLAGACNYVSNLFFLHLGISLDQLGQFRTYMAIPAVLLIYPFAWLSDRFHPARAAFWAMLVMPVFSLLAFFFVHDFRTMVIISIVSLPDNLFFAVAYVPLSMLLWPKERYGQFGSADAAVRSISTIIMSFAAGFFLDFMKRLYGGNEEYYRWFYIWTAFFQFLAFLLIWRVYRYWKQYGGLKYYMPPDVSQKAVVRKV